MVLKANTETKRNLCNHSDGEIQEGCETETSEPEVRIEAGDNGIVEQSGV